MNIRFLLAFLLAMPPFWAGGAARAQATLSDHEAAEAARDVTIAMRQALGTNGIPASAAQPSAASARAAAMAREMLASAGIVIDRPQLVLVVDRAPAVQRLWVMLAEPDPGPGSGLGSDRGSEPADPWKMLGVVHVSTGRPGRKEHFKTPVGVFTNTPAILGYRAQGTLNEHGIRGNGIKGMRVWDFGWQTVEDWRKDGALTAVRLEMHATDPKYLAGRLGRPDSEACIRIPEKFNTFLDRAGLIDAQLFAAAPDDRAVRALLPKDGQPTPIAGDKVVVVDSSEPGAARSDPVLAEQINQNYADFLTQKAALAAAAAGTPVPGAAVPGAAVPGTGAPGVAGVVPAAATTAPGMSPRASSGVSSLGGSEPTPVDPVPPLPDPVPGPALPAPHAAASPGR